MYTDVSITTFVHYHHSHENKERFLKEKKRVKGLFVFMTMLSFKQVKSSFGKKSPLNKVAVGLLGFSLSEFQIT